LLGEDGPGRDRTLKVALRRDHVKKTGAVRGGTPSIRYWWDRGEVLRKLLETLIGTGLIWRHGQREDEPAPLPHRATLHLDERLEDGVQL
jgi:hypothetical protein